MSLLSLDNLILKLFEVQAVKFGSFTLKSGSVSPVYIDLRVIISFPTLMKQISELIWKTAENNNIKYSSLCGVPYTALPMATCISTEHDIPMLIRRKEAKDYGTKKQIEGDCSKGSNCLIIEDVVTTGSSVIETAKSLKEHNVVVTDAIVLLNREQGGSHNLRTEGINLQSVLTLTQVMDVLLKHEKIDTDTVQKVKNFLAKNNSFKPAKVEPCLKYGDRANIAKHPVARRLFEIMERKQTNLCFSADVESFMELLELADKLGPFICCVKTHVDVLEDFSGENIERLVSLSKEHEFLIFEDRKFADIGNTVMMQYSGGSFRISNWADVVNAHSLPGPGVVAGLHKAVAERKDRACLLIAEMSCQGNLLDAKYKEATLKIANEQSDFVIGFISGGKISKDPCHIHLTPGVKLCKGKDKLGQCYSTPDDVIRGRGSDVIIVGRGIIESENRIEAARQYRDAAWLAYIRRMSPKERQFS